MKPYFIQKIRILEDAIFYLLKHETFSFYKIEENEKENEKKKRKNRD